MSFKEPANKIAGGITFTIIFLGGMMIALASLRTNQSMDQSNKQDDFANVSVVKVEEESETIIATEVVLDDQQEKLEQAYKNLDPTIYNVALMQENQIAPIQVEDYPTIENLIETTMSDMGMSSDSVAIVYYDMMNGTNYDLNGNEFMIAASTTKIIYACMFLDLVNQGWLSLDTPIPYNPSLYMEGSGSITNGEPLDVYTISELMDEMIISSDNTATNHLYAYYMNLFGSVQEGMKIFAGLDEVNEDYYNDNYMTAEGLSDVLYLVATSGEYDYLLDLLKSEKTPQLFTSYVYPMANKFGRIDDYTHDAGIYYENDQAQYILVVMTQGLGEAESFIEMLNLRVSQWYRTHYILGNQHETTEHAA